MNVMQVFFPDCAVGVRSGLCIGWMDQRKHTICILAVVHLPIDLHQVTRQLQMTASIRQQPLTVLGPLTHRGDPDRGKLQQLCTEICHRPLIELIRADIYSLPTCSLFQDGRPTTLDYHLILYNQSKILACCLPSNDDTVGMPRDTETSTSHSNPSSSGDNDGNAEDHERSILKFETVLSVIQEGVWQLSTLRDWDVSMDVKTQGGKSSLISRFVSSLVWMLVSMVNFCFLPFRSDFCRRLSQSAVFQRMMTFTQTGCQILAKYNSMQHLLEVHGKADGRYRFRGELKSKNRFESLRTGSLWTYVLTDMLLGMLLMWWIQRHSWPDVWADWIISSASTTANLLQTLLQWLMGAPAGLKLNSGLAHFLGQFFLYHVYLWIGYLSIIQPVLGWAIWCMSLTGCLGVSVILAVASDMVSMLTFHIYCFYVYAARIYRLQLTGLLALSRLFRGKKWNVLRKRVDTCHYDVDQLFIGTLLFTILLFLLPTTILFYAVFTMLRLAVIALKGILMKTIDLLKMLPTYSILLSLTGSDLCVSGVNFDLMRQPGEGYSRALVMQVQHMGICDVLWLSYEASKTESSHQESSASRNPIVSLLMDLITGCLIYPWGLAQNKSQE